MKVDVLPVLIKSDEYCFLWINWWATCLTKSEWASWVQAFGAIFAIFASAAIAGRQFINSEIVKEESAARVLMQFFAQIDLFYRQWPEIAKTEDKKSIEFFYSLDNFEKVLSENFEILKGVPLENLSAEWSTCCVFARSTCIQLLLAVSRYKREINIFNKIIDSKEENFDEELNKKFSQKSMIIEDEILNFKTQFDDQLLMMKKSMDKVSRFSSPKDMKEYFDMRRM